MKKALVWPSVSFVLSLAASAVCGRALWCDEILRISGQHYTIAQLFAFKHLHDFCTQTPTGYLFMRPFQLLLGYEFGGCLVSALAAATITLCTILLVRRFNGRCGVLASAVVATNPLLVYYGGELAFYEMWAAAFAAAFALLPAIDDARPFVSGLRVRIAFVAAGALFVTFHFAGMFVWAGLAAVAVIDWWARKGFRDAVLRGIFLAVPMAVNLPMYLGAEGKAIHLGSQQVMWSRLSVLPGQIADYMVRLFPSFTGAGPVGVAVFAAGLLFLFRVRETRRVATLAVGGILSVVFFLAYSGLHDYIPPTCRYWIYALTPTLFAVATGLERMASRNVRVARCLAVVMLAANFVADTPIVLASGRDTPYRRLVAALAGHDVPVRSVAYVNHYEGRFFGGYYRLPDGTAPLYPSYWEQGEQVRTEGMRRIRGLSPLTPVYVVHDGEAKLLEAAGYVSTNRTHETHPPFHDLAIRLGVAPGAPARGGELPWLVLPLESEIVAAAENAGKPVFAPGAGWTIRQMPPRAKDEPFTPFLTLAPHAEARLRVYVPRTVRTGRLTLEGLVGSDRTGSAVLGGKTVPLGKAMTPVAIDVPSPRKGEWNEISVRAGGTVLAFAQPRVR